MSQLPSDGSDPVKVSVPPEVLPFPSPVTTTKGVSGGSDPTSGVSLSWVGLKTSGWEEVSGVAPGSSNEFNGSWLLMFGAGAVLARVVAFSV